MLWIKKTVRKQFLKYLFIFFIFPIQNYCFEIGLKGGYNFNNLYGDSTTFEYLGKTLTLNKYFYNSFNCGIFFNQDIYKKFSLQIEILYVTKGAQIEYKKNEVYNDPLVGDIFVTYNYSGDLLSKYLEFPILMKYNFYQSNTIKFNLLIGPYYSILLAARNKFSGKTTLNNEILGYEAYELNLNNSIYDKTKKYDLGFVFATNIDYSFNPNYFVGIDFRYEMGLINIDKSEFNKKIKNISLSLLFSAGYKY